MDLVINNVTNVCNFVGKMVCLCVCVCVYVCVYLELLSHFLPFKIHLTNISPVLIKMVDFKNLAWATSFATRASRKFTYLPCPGKKVIVIPCSYNSFITARTLKYMVIVTEQTQLKLQRHHAKCQNCHIYRV